ncbi:MAG: diguanylate cyclase [Devosia nanyangense]|uniref:diguanylate cyclase n=1 Tax=Devosia nanyangense TaxID=1228055 RepID=A0A933L433_9HYPH|nr:diguanylate cyclase [Devosia nanyangense]
MAIPNIPPEQMRSALKELQQAVYNHEQWAENLHATLICHLPPDLRDTGTDAHRNCRFGQWFYSAGAAALADHPGVAEIGHEHERMHQYARTLLTSSTGGVPISIGDYERFVSTMKRLRLEIETVQSELQDALYNLDPLTGTPSRIGMLSKLREQHEFVVRKVRPCTVAMFDLDHFKAVNDQYGHLTGDKVLVDIAHYIVAHLRPYDKVFRYGGEEFLICLPDTDAQTGRDIIDRLRAELGSLMHAAADGRTFQVTISFGVTLLDPDIPVEQSIDRADKALYVAKATGRNRTVIWDASMNGTPEPAATT